MADTIEGLLQEARNSANSRSWGRAIELYSKALGLDADNDEACRSLTQIYALRGMFKSVVSTYLQLMHIYIARNDFDNALAVANYVLLLSPESVEIREELINIYRARGEVAEVVARSLDLARLYIELDEGERSLNLLQAILNDDPSNIEVSKELAEMYIQYGQVENGVNQYRQVSELYYSSGELDKACEALERLLVINAGDSGAVFRLGEFYSAAERWEDAERQFRSALKFDFGNLDVLFALGDVCQRKGDLDQASLAFRKIVMTAPDYVLAQERLAEIYHIQSNVEQAVKGYLAAASLYANSGNGEKAVALYQRVIALDPANPTATRELTNLGAPVVGNDGGIKPVAKEKPQKKGKKAAEALKQSKGGAAHAGLIPKSSGGRAGLVGKGGLKPSLGSKPVLGGDNSADSPRPGLMRAGLKMSKGGAKPMLGGKPVLGSKPTLGSRRKSSEPEPEEVPAEVNATPTEESMERPEQSAEVVGTSTGEAEVMGADDAEVAAVEEQADSSLSVKNTDEMVSAGEPVDMPKEGAVGAPPPDFVEADVVKAKVVEAQVIKANYLTEATEDDVSALDQEVPEGSLNSQPVVREIVKQPVQQTIQQVQVMGVVGETEGVQNTSELVVISRTSGDVAPQDEQSGDYGSVAASSENLLDGKFQGGAVEEQYAGGANDYYADSNGEQLGSDELFEGGYDGGELLGGYDGATEAPQLSGGDYYPQEGGAQPVAEVESPVDGAVDDNSVQEPLAVEQQAVVGASTGVTGPSLVYLPQEYGGVSTPILYLERPEYYAAIGSAVTAPPDPSVIPWEPLAGVDGGAVEEQLQEQEVENADGRVNEVAASGENVDGTSEEQGFDSGGDLKTGERAGGALHRKISRHREEAAPAHRSIGGERLAERMARMRENGENEERSSERRISGISHRTSTIPSHPSSKKPRRGIMGGLSRPINQVREEAGAGVNEQEATVVPEPGPQTGRRTRASLSERIKQARASRHVAEQAQSGEMKAVVTESVAENPVAPAPMVTDESTQAQTQVQQQQFTQEPMQDSSAAEMTFSAGAEQPQAQYDGQDYTQSEAVGNSGQESYGYQEGYSEAGGQYTELYGAPQAQGEAQAVEYGGQEVYPEQYGQYSEQPQGYDEQSGQYDAPQPGYDDSGAYQEQYGQYYGAEQTGQYEGGQPGYEDQGGYANYGEQYPPNVGDYGYGGQGFEDSQGLYGNAEGYGAYGEGQYPGTEGGYDYSGEQHFDDGTGAYAEAGGYVDHDDQQYVGAAEGVDYAGEHPEAMPVSYPEVSGQMQGGAEVAEAQEEVEAAYQAEALVNEAQGGAVSEATGLEVGSGVGQAQPVENWQSDEGNLGTGEVSAEVIDDRSAVGGDGAFAGSPEAGAAEVSEAVVEPLGGAAVPQEAADGSEQLLGATGIVSAETEYSGVEEASAQGTVEVGLAEGGQYTGVAPEAGQEAYVEGAEVGRLQREIVTEARVEELDASQVEFQEVGAERTDVPELVVYERDDTPEVDKAIVPVRVKRHKSRRQAKAERALLEKAAQAALVEAQPQDEVQVDGPLEDTEAVEIDQGAGDEVLSAVEAGNVVEPAQEGLSDIAAGEEIGSVEQSEELLTDQVSEVVAQVEETVGGADAQEQGHLEAEVVPTLQGSTSGEEQTDFVEVRTGLESVEISGAGVPTDGLCSLAVESELPEEYIEEAKQLRVRLAGADVTTSIGDYRRAVENSPENLLLRTDLADIHLRFSLMDDAINQYRQILRRKPDSVALRHRLACAYLWNEDFDEAIKVYLDLVNLHIKNDQYADAVDVLQTILSLDPQNFTARRLLIDRFIEQDKKDLATHHLRQFVEASLSLGSTGNAISALKQLIELSDDPVFVERLAKVYVDSNDVNEALIYYRRLSEQYTSLEKWPEALEVSEKIVALDSQDFDERRRLIELYQTLGRYDKAIAEQFVLAGLYSKAGRMDEAAELYEAVVKKDSNHYEARRCLVDCYLEKNNLEAAMAQVGPLTERYESERMAGPAIEMYTKLIVASPDSIDLHEHLLNFYTMDRQQDNMLGELLKLEELREAKGEYREAVRYLSRAIELAPEQADLHCRLAKLYDEQLHSISGAMQEYKKVFELSPGDSVTMRRYALLLVEQRKSKEAAQVLLKLQSVDKAGGKVVIDEICKMFLDRIAEDGADLNTRYNYGELCYYLNRVDDAIEQFQKTHVDRDLELRSRNMLGLSFIKKPRMREVAIRQFRQGLEIKGHAEQDYLELRYNLAMLFCQSDRLQEALTEFKSILAFDVTYRDVEARVKDLQEKIAAGGGTSKTRGTSPRRRQQ